MEWNRREFLKIAGATTAVTAFGGPTEVDPDGRKVMAP